MQIHAVFDQTYKMFFQLCPFCVIIIMIFFKSNKCFNERMYTNIWDSLYDYGYIHVILRTSMTVDWDFVCRDAAYGQRAKTKVRKRHLKFVASRFKQVQLFKSQICTCKMRSMGFCKYTYNMFICCVCVSVWLFENTFITNIDTCLCLLSFEITCSSLNLMLPLLVDPGDWVNEIVFHWNKYVLM